MKTNFSNDELVMVLHTIGNKMVMNINRCGNITLRLPGDVTQKWTLRNQSGRYILNRFNYKTGYDYPLNMRNRKAVVYDRYYSAFKNASFDTVKDALTYFKRYMNKFYDVQL